MNADDTTEPATFAAVLSLIGLIVDAPACKARILELQRRADQARDLQAKLAAERTSHERKVETDRTEFAAIEARLRAREVAAAEADARLAVADEIIAAAKARGYREPGESNLQPGGNLRRAVG